MASIKQIYRQTDQLLNKDITLKGWVRTLRSSKNFGFIELNDGSFFKTLQVVFSDDLPNFAEISKYHTGAALEVSGKLVESPGAKQPFELHASSIILVGDSTADYPLQKKRHTFEYLRTIAHLRPRTNTFTAVFRVRSILAQAIHRFFEERDFIYVHTPIITTSDAEGAGEMFTVSSYNFKEKLKLKEQKLDFSDDFFSKQAHLTVSGQLEGEIFAQAFRNIYTFGPTFRAENSNTARHVAEFWMIEPEIAFANLQDDMQLAEDMMKYLIRSVLDKAPEEMDFFDQFIEKGIIQKLQNIEKASFERITYTEAISHLAKAEDSFEFKPEWGHDLQTEHERYLTEKVLEKPVFVTDYPKDIKAFYMRLNDDEKTVAAMDLLVPGVGEIIGGSQREDRLELLESKLQEQGLNKDDYWWYLDLRKYGSTPHAGYGLGFARAVMYMTGMQNIRDVIPFARTPGNAEF